MFETQLAQVVLAQPAPKRYLVALSGGVDSIALLHGLVRILPAQANVVALHGNHQISRESSTWAAHCAAQCQSLAVDFVCEELVLAPQGNLEAAAREARYAFFARHMQARDLLLLGHHAQDQLETLFLRLFQGRGLISMRQQGALGEGQFLRPLLNCSRSELVAYAQSIDASWIEDPSNADIRFDRNFLRHQIIPKFIPMLQKRWPGVTQAILRVAANAQAQNTLLQNLIEPFADEVPLNQLPSDRASRLLWLRTYLALRGHHEISDRGLSEWLRQAECAEQSELVLGEVNFLRSWRGSLYYVKRQQQTAFSGTLLALGERVSGGFGSLELAPCDSALSDAFVYSGPVEIVCRNNLENLSLSRSFGSASLKMLFQQGNIPPWCREEYPLIMQSGELLAVPGIASRDKGQDTSAHAHSSVWCRGILRN